MFKGYVRTLLTFVGCLAFWAPFPHKLVLGLSYARLAPNNYGKYLLGEILMQNSFSSVII